MTRLTRTVAPKGSLYRIFSGRVWLERPHWLADCPVLDVITQGSTETEARGMLADAVKSLLNLQQHVQIDDDPFGGVTKYGRGVQVRCDDMEPLLRAAAKALGQAAERENMDKVRGIPPELRHLNEDIPQISARSPRPVIRESPGVKLSELPCWTCNLRHVIGQFKIGELVTALVARNVRHTLADGDDISVGEFGQVIEWSQYGCPLYYRVVFPRGSNEWPRKASFDPCQLASADWQIGTR